MLLDEGPARPQYDLPLTRYVLSVLISKSPSAILGVRTSTDEFWGGCNSTRHMQGGDFSGTLSIQVRGARPFPHNCSHMGFLPEPSRCRFSLSGATVLSAHVRCSTGTAVVKLMT